MPADPVLNEKMILVELRDEYRPVTVNTMRSMCSLVLMCAYDRKVERFFFAELVDDIARLSMDLAELEKAGAMRAVLMKLDETREPKLLDEQITKLVTGFLAKKRSLANKLDLISQCPGANVKVS